jgi:K+-sensing histidine kinase KdpD
MHRVASLPIFKIEKEQRWRRYLLDTLLALGSIFSITALIWFFQLYQKIPDSFLVYTLAILALAGLRGLFPALLASFVAFFSFDILFVPPLYRLNVFKFEDILTLLIFLITAVITSQFAATLRQRVEDAHHREQARIRMEALQRTDALRLALLSSVSHDIRTPLSTIKTAITSLGEEDVQWDEETRRGFIASIERETDRLNNLVENLLDMSRIEAGLLHPERVWYPLDELILDVLDRMDTRLQGRKVETHLPALLPPVELDYVMIDQVLTNLLENAIRYTPVGSPIDVSVQQHNKEVVVSIADRGPGIAAEEREQIFDKFYRVKGKTSDSGTTQGTGLGLAICRGLIEAHGGTILVEARPGGGADFRFTLPLSNSGEMELL